MEFYNKDIQILKQSQLKNVIEYCKLMNIQPTVSEMFRMTDVFIEFCLKASTPEYKETVKKLETFISSKTKNNEQ